jgi:hypothetical protein
VANKSTGCDTSVEVPKTESVVPRGRESELAVRGDDDVRDEMIMSTKDTLWISIRILVASEMPDDNCLI